MKSTSLAD